MEESRLEKETKKQGKFSKIIEQWNQYQEEKKKTGKKYRIHYVDNILRILLNNEIIDYTQFPHGNRVIHSSNHYAIP